MKEEAGATTARFISPVPGQTILSAFNTVIIGFGSTILLVVEAARVLDATPAQSASWAAALCFGMALTTLVLSSWYRIPVITAWSTPGVVLVATTASGTSFPNAIGAFLFAGLLMCLTAAFRPLTKLVQQIPAPIAAAMLAGILLRYCLNVPSALAANPLLVAPVVVIYFALRLRRPVLATPLAVAAGIGIAVAAGAMDPDCCRVGVTLLSWTTPEFELSSLIGLGMPLYLVTMASQNLPGFAVLKQAGYEPPIKAALWVTGLASIVLAPFGAHAVTMAALTAALCTGPDCHPDSRERWRVAQPYFVIYMLLGLFSGTVVELLASMPPPLIKAIAGLGLLVPLISAVPAMTKDERCLDAALIAFLVTASGVSVLSIGSAFWGLAAGVIFHLLKIGLAQTQNQR
ncbi:MAG TPA: benzoate/H(+) symporter BenE family transporter [Aestuariivirgaceae bacterium]|jgi:benzoate membrane transport protein